MLPDWPVSTCTVRPRFTGSGSSLVQAFGNGERIGQEAGTKKFNTRASVHLTLQCFETVNVSFDRSVAPFLSDRRFYGPEVLFESPNKSRHGMDAGVLRSLHPQTERGQLPQTKEGAKTQHQFPLSAKSGHCCLKVSTSSPCCKVKSVRNLLNSAAAT